MRKPENIEIKAYNYPLPEDRIAKYPLADRDASKLLVYRNQEIIEDRFENASLFLSEKDQLFFNKTKVVQARLKFKKATGAQIEIFCLEPHNPSDYQLAYASSDPVEMLCLVGNAKKWKDGILENKIQGVCGAYTLTAENLGRINDSFLIRFSWDNKDISFATVLEEAGSTPIPPYLKRNAEQKDARSYQTVYAEKDGSVAAPTAGLHFTDKVLSEMKTKGIELHELVLHVGAGTFIPVKEENAVNHNMHAETVHIDLALLNALQNKNKRKIAVGTTTTRSLESLYWVGVIAKNNSDFSFENIFLKQWDAYELDDALSLDEALEALLLKMNEKGITEFSFQTQIMITPAYKFKIIDGLFTNYHQPQSTLLLLVSAVVGDDWRKIYDYALGHEFRFLSYGDSSLLFVQDASEHK